MFDFDFYQLSCMALWFFAYSFLGWLFEVIIAFGQHGRFVNRGFGVGPVCPIYGVGALIGIVVLAPLDNVVAEFVVGFILAAILEYGASWGLEQLFHARWWDYSNLPFNLNGRICLGGITLFSLLMILVNHGMQPLLNRIITLVPHSLVEVMALTFVGLFTWDIVWSALRMADLDDKLAVAQERFKQLAGDMASLVPDAARDKARDAMETTKDWMLQQEWVETLRSMMPDFSRVPRHFFKDPAFVPTKAREAWELIKTFADTQEADSAVVFTTQTPSQDDVSAAHKH